MIEAASELGNKLLVIVNNDKQQLLKKGKVILSEQNRARLMGALKHVDEVRIAIDTDPPVTQTLEKIAQDYPNDELVFANGGDRNSTKEIPETEVCEKYNIEMVFGVGGDTKYDSSTRINQATGHETQ